MLPRNGLRGKQWRDHRQVINGILWRLRVGAPWRDVPRRYGPWQTCYDRFVRWRCNGTWDRLLAHVLATADARGEIDWVVCVDGMVVRAHQHAAGARRQPSNADRAANIEHPPDEALGRGRPLAVVVTPGQRHESTQLAAVLDAIRVPRPGGNGRPRKRPERRDQRRRRAGRRGRPLRFDAARYRQRNMAERGISALKQWRGVASRHEKRAVNYRAAVVIFALIRWLAA